MLDIDHGTYPFMSLRPTHWLEASHQAGGIDPKGPFGLCAGYFKSIFPPG
ncbi:MAG: hypothetical protein CM1200mP4_3980 [Rhodospirillaceae bacterium]|nr:MAG: hypothetical protein CM1200mP4_3980 [Rhodospirillaceae bacterium]